MNQPTDPSTDDAGFAGLGRALRHRNFRLYFLGQGVSLLGTWMQQIALSWLVYRITEASQQALMLGLVNFANQIPSLLLLPLAGVLLDRSNRFRLVVATQTLAMCQAFVLALLTFAHLLAVWPIMGLAFLLGCVNAFDLPARQALLPALLMDRRDLANAIALNSSVFNGARLVGPALAGLLIALAPGGLGEALCFLLNGLSYLAVLLALLVMQIQQQPEIRPVSVVAGLLEGVRFLFADRPICAIVLLVAWTGFISFPYTILMPLLAGQVLGGQAETYGLLMSAWGTGALIGAVYLATRRGLHGARRGIVLSGVVFGVSLLALSQVRGFTLALPVLVLVGFGMMVTMVSCNTIVQTLVPDDKRGRIMSLFTLAFMGLTPFGSLLIGWCAHQWDTPTALAICGAGSLLGIVVFTLYLGRVQEATDVRSVSSVGPAGGQ